MVFWSASHAHKQRSYTWLRAGHWATWLSGEASGPCFNDFPPHHSSRENSWSISQLTIMVKVQSEIPWGRCYGPDSLCMVMWSGKPNLWLTQNPTGFSPFGWVKPPFWGRQAWLGSLASEAHARESAEQKWLPLLWRVNLKTITSSHPPCQWLWY